MTRPRFLAHTVAVFVVACTTLVSAATFELTTATITEIQSAFDSGVLSSEKLVALCLARIEAYDQTGPSLNAVITVNPNALQRARELDDERRRRGARSPMHGIPVVLKDNYDTADLPTTAGSFMLAGSLPPDDAYVVAKLRAAGAIVLAKLNMSEFASGAALSSIAGPTRNPHDPARSPSGSSGGSGAAIAAAYAPIGFGTDTGGSVRGPAAANGIVGLKTTHGLLSRDGIVPLGLSFDTAGPMARDVESVAIVLGTLTGVDPADHSTRKSDGKFDTDYTRFLNRDALRGARVGIARDFLESDPDVDWVVEASLAAIRDAGATVVEVRFPEWLLDSERKFYDVIRHREFPAQIKEYLATLDDGYPKTLDELVARSMKLTSPSEQGYVPNPSRWNLMKRELDAGSLEDYEYLSVHEHGLPLIRGIIEGILNAEQLDAIVYPSAPRRPSRRDADPGTSVGGPSPVRLANMSGFPDLIVPAGFTGTGLPVCLSFLGPAFGESRLIALGYAFEQATKAQRLPAHTPPLPGERFDYEPISAQQ
jgi:amidase